MQSDLVLAINVDNGLVHVGPGGELVEHITVVTKKDRDPLLGFEFYDICGSRLILKKVDGHFALTESKSPIEVDEQTLLERIYEGLTILQRYLDENPDAGNQGGGRPPITTVPRPEGSFPDVLEQLAQLMSPLDPDARPDQGNWFHNLWHAATGTS